MLKKEPATHKKQLRTFKNDEFTVTLYEIGIRYHTGRYTPEIAYFVSLNGNGKQFTGKTAFINALHCYEVTCESIDSKYYEKENVKINTQEEEQPSPLMVEGEGAPQYTMFDLPKDTQLALL